MLNDIISRIVGIDFHALRSDILDACVGLPIGDPSQLRLADTEPEFCSLYLSLDPLIEMPLVLIHRGRPDVAGAVAFDGSDLLHAYRDPEAFLLPIIEMAARAMTNRGA